MKKALITLIVLSFALVGSAQTIDCKKFKEGVFYYPTLPDKISVRKDSVQESYNNGVLEMIWEVKWLDECEFELICKKVLVDPSPIEPGDRIVATIVETTEDCFTTSLVFFNNANPEGQIIPSGEMCIKKE